MVLNIRALWEAFGVSAVADQMVLTYILLCLSAGIVVKIITVIWSFNRVPLAGLKEPVLQRHRSGHAMRQKPMSFTNSAFETEFRDDFEEPQQEVDQGGQMEVELDIARVPAPVLPPKRGGVRGLAEKTLPEERRRLDRKPAAIILDGYGNKYQEAPINVSADVRDTKARLALKARLAARRV